MFRHFLIIILSANLYFGSTTYNRGPQLEIGMTLPDMKAKANKNVGIIKTRNANLNCLVTRYFEKATYRKGTIGRA